MPLTLDDKLLGEKSQYYASSSEDESGDDEINENPDQRPKNDKKTSMFESPDPEDDNPFSDQRKRAAWNKKYGEIGAKHTGPKGVINDKKLYAAEQILNQLDKNNESDDFLEQYRKQRLLELQQRAFSNPVVTTNSEIEGYSEINSGQYLDMISSESGGLILMHLYDEEEFMCDLVDESLNLASSRYSDIRFYKIRSRDLGSTSDFIEKAVPAIQAFRSGKLIDTVLKPEIVSQISEDFSPEDFIRVLRNSFNF